MDFKRNLKIQQAEGYMVNEVRCKIEYFTLITSFLTDIGISVIKVYRRVLSKNLTFNLFEFCIQAIKKDVHS